MLDGVSDCELRERYHRNVGHYMLIGALNAHLSGIRNLMLKIQN